MFFLLMGGSHQVLPQFGAMEGNFLHFSRRGLEKMEHFKAVMHGAVYIC